MLKLVADDSHKGFIYALDIQKGALDKTSSLLEESLNPTEVRTKEEHRISALNWLRLKTIIYMIFTHLIFYPSINN